MALAKFAYQQGATVDKKRRISCAASVPKRETAVSYIKPTMARRRLSGGWVSSNVSIFASVHSTVESTSVEKNATGRILSQPIARARLTSFRTVLVGRRLSAMYQMSHGLRATIQYRIAQDLAEPNCTAATSVRSDVIKASVHLVCKQSISTAVADARLPPPSVTKELRSLLTA